MTDQSDQEDGFDPEDTDEASMLVWGFAPEGYWHWMWGYWYPEADKWAVCFETGKHTDNCFLAHGSAMGLDKEGVFQLCKAAGLKWLAGVRDQLINAEMM